MSDRKSSQVSAGLILIAVGLGLYLIDRVEGIGSEAVMLIIGLVTGGLRIRRCRFGYLDWRWCLIRHFGSFGILAVACVGSVRFRHLWTSGVSFAGGLKRRSIVTRRRLACICFGIAVVARRVTAFLFTICVKTGKLVSGRSRLWNWDFQLCTQFASQCVIVGMNQSRIERLLPTKDTQERHHLSSIDIGCITNGRKFLT